MAQSLLLSALGDEALTVQQIQAVLRKTLEQMLAAQQRAAQEEAVRLVACAANSGAAAVVALTERKAAKAEDAEPLLSVELIDSLVARTEQWCAVFAAIGVVTPQQPQPHPAAAAAASSLTDSTAAAAAAAT